MLDIENKIERFDKATRQRDLVWLQDREIWYGYKIERKQVSQEGGDGEI